MIRKKNEKHPHPGPLPNKGEGEKQDWSQRDFKFQGFEISEGGEEQ